MVLGNWTALYRRRKLECDLSPCTEIWKCIKDLNLEPETLKLLQENIGKILQDIDIGNSILNKTPIIYHIIAKK
jgi:hypothetical protein